MTSPRRHCCGKTKQVSEKKKTKREPATGPHFAPIQAAPSCVPGRVFSAPEPIPATLRVKVACYLVRLERLAVKASVIVSTKCSKVGGPEAWRGMGVSRASRTKMRRFGSLPGGLCEDPVSPEARPAAWLAPHILPELRAGLVALSHGSLDSPPLRRWHLSTKFTDCHQRSQSTKPGLSYIEGTKDSCWNCPIKPPVVPGHLSTSTSRRLLEYFKMSPPNWVAPRQ